MIYRMNIDHMRVRLDGGEGLPLFSGLPCSTNHLYELFLVEIGKLEARLTPEQESHHGRYRERSADHI